MDTAPQLPRTPFTLAEATVEGFSRDQLRRKELTGVSRGLYRHTSWDFELWDAARALSAATPDAWISHSSAALLHGLILPPWLSDSTELHLSKPKKLPRTRRKGIIGHTLIAYPDEVEDVAGLRISTRARTWLDLARTLSLPDLVCQGDQLIRNPRAVFEGRDAPYTTMRSLRAMLDRHQNLQGIVRAREAIELMRVGSDSGPETRLRLAMLDAGLPEPDLQLSLWAQVEAPSSDLGYRTQRIAIQYDGAHHLDEAQKFSDRRRDNAFTAAGWTVLTFTQEDLAENFERAIHQIKRALRTGWTDPAVAAGFA